MIPITRSFYHLSLGKSILFSERTGFFAKVPEPRKLKSGNYFIQLRLNGMSIPVTASTAKECKRQAELIKAEHRAGKREITAMTPVLSLDKAIGDYINSRRNLLSPSTIRGYEIILKNRFKEQMKEKLNAINWQSAINAEAKVCGAKTLKNAWGLIASVLSYHQLPVSKVKLPQIKPTEKEWLEPEHPGFCSGSSDRAVRDPRAVCPAETAEKSV